MTNIRKSWSPWFADRVETKRRPRSRDFDLWPEMPVKGVIVAGERYDNGKLVEQWNDVGWWRDYA